jgi:hypothetical protein
VNFGGGEDPRRRRAGTGIRALQAGLGRNAKCNSPALSKRRTIAIVPARSFLT